MIDDRAGGRPPGAAPNTVAPPRRARIRQARGTTRTVWLVGRWAVKTPSTRRVWPHRVSRVHAFARGWTANLSEWRFRRHPGICAPRWTALGLVQVYPRAGAVGAAELFASDPDDPALPSPEVFPTPPGLVVDRTWSNLGAFGSGTHPVWIDYDQTDQNR